MHLDENGIVTLVEKRVVRKVAFSDLAQTIMDATRKKCFCTPVLPGVDGACRMYAETERAVGFLMQVNPGVRTIRFQNKLGHPTARAYREDLVSEDVSVPEGRMYLFDVSMPWIWVLCKFLKVRKNVYRWWRCFLCSTYSNIGSPQDPVFFAPVPNQYPSGRMCTGDVMDDSSDDTDRPALICRKWLFKIWQSHFNDDLQRLPLPQGILADGWLMALDKWETLSMGNPGIGLSRDLGLIPYSWNASGGTLGEFVDLAMSGDIDAH